MELMGSFILSALGSKTRVAAMALAALAFLQYSGVQPPPGLKELFEAVAAWGIRDAISKGK